jgi:prolyl oligopeptidase
MPLVDFIHAPIEEVIHGVLVRDPYRWLEDRLLPETEEWILDQHRRCEEYFSDFSRLQVLRQRVCEHLDIEVVDQPAKVAGRYFFRRRNTRQEQACIYVREAGSTGERLLVDPAVMGPFTSVGIHRISNDGSLMAFELKHDGSDRKAIQIVDIKTGEVLPDGLATGYARGFAFTEDCRGFYYCHETSVSSEEHVVCFHLLGESLGDEIVFRTARSGGNRLVLIADTMHLGIILVHQRAEPTEVVADFYLATEEEPHTWTKVFLDRRLPYSPILKHGRIFAISYQNAPNGRLVELNTAGVEIRTIVPEQSVMIRQLVIGNDRVFCSYLFDLVPTLLWWSLSDGDTGAIAIPSNGTVHLVANHSEAEEHLFYTHESFAEPPAIFEFIPEAGTSRIRHRQSLPFRRVPCSLRHVFIASKDGTKIPMVLVAAEPYEGTSARPAIMTGYGGFGVAMTPQYSVLVSIMLELGAVFAVPQIRGGGEFGREWHEAARKRNRQVAFDDFIAAAEWLCMTGETSCEKLGIFGGSNSGLLVCAAMTQRPDLFRAVLSIAPLLDMVRYERFDQAARWLEEYGSIENEEDFKALYAYSPYHHVNDGGDYPAILFVTGDKDDRCNPAHVRKMAASLQQRPLQTHPVLVDCDPNRGHAPAMPLSVRVEALMRRISFLCRELSIPIDAGGSDETANS